MNNRLIIALEDITLSFGGKPVFEGASVHIHERDRVCLVGRNGAGKSTLMKLIASDIEPDVGRHYVLPGLVIGHLQQQPAYNAKQTVHEYVLDGLSKQDIEDGKSYLADMVLAPLQLNPDALMGSLSGGQVRRSALAQSLVHQPDVLLLDEPTNHMDMQTIEWLEGHLAAYPGTVVCVSHDRAFLAAVSRKVFWIDRGTIRTCPTGYGGFEDWAEEQLQQEARELHNMQKKMEAEHNWTQGGVTGRRKRNVRRLRELEQLRDKIRNDKAAYLSQRQKIALDPLTPVQASKVVVEFKHVNKAYGTLPILKDFNLRVMKGERIGILGRNGSGKSTFLRMLLGQESPDSGHIKRGKTAEFVYFDQHRSALDPTKTLWQTLCPDGGDHVFFEAAEEGKERRSMHVCGYLKKFLFDPKLARDRVSTLSGGQQNRLMLAYALAHPGNVLVLDEPTNDLDMDTLDMLQEILADYPGTLFIVSHDRDFLDRTVSEVLAFEGNAQVERHIGGYSDYLAATKGLPVQHEPTKAVPVAVKVASVASNKLSYKLKHELEQLPGLMKGLETELEKLRALLADPEFYTTNPQGFDDATSRYAEAQAELEQAESRWLELEELREQAEAS